MLKTAKTGRRAPAPSRGGDDLDKIQALYQAGKRNDAISGLKALVQSQPKSARLRVRLGEWLAAAGRRDEAISTLFALQELLAASGNVLAAISAGVKPSARATATAAAAFMRLCSPGGISLPEPGMVPADFPVSNSR